MDEEAHKEGPRTDLTRLRDWLLGEVRVSRAILVGGSVLLLLAIGVALD